MVPESHKGLVYTFRTGIETWCDKLELGVRLPPRLPPFIFERDHEKTEQT